MVLHRIHCDDCGHAMSWTGARCDFCGAPKPGVQRLSVLTLFVIGTAVAAVLAVKGS